MDTVIGVLIVLVIVGFIAYKKVPQVKEAIDKLLKKKPEAVVPPVAPIPVGTTTPHTPVPPIPATGTPAHGSLAWWEALPASTRAHVPKPGSSDAEYRDGLASIVHTDQQLTATDGMIVPVGTGGFNVSGVTVRLKGAHHGAIEIDVSPKSPKSEQTTVLFNGERLGGGLNGYDHKQVVSTGSFTLDILHDRNAVSWVVLIPR